jgi:hypothetical protein
MGEQIDMEVVANDENDETRPGECMKLCGARRSRRRRGCLSTGTERQQTT